MGAPATSTVSDSGPAFKLFPPIIQFTQAVQDGHPKPRVFTVVIQNLRSRKITVRYAPPKTGAWKLLDTEPIIHLAGGLEHSFKVAFQEPARPEEEEEQNEDMLEFHDRLKVMTSDFTYELELHALAPTAKLEVEGSLDYGIQTLESSSTRVLCLRNHGAKEAKFELECEVTGLETTITPEAGVLAPGGSMDVEVACSFGELGSFSGDLLIKEGNASDELTGKIRIGCTVIQQTLEILEAGGAMLKELKFGSLNFEDESEYEIEMLNNGPTPVQWRGFVLTKSDHRAKLQYQEDQAHEDGVDVGSYMMAARLRKMTGDNIPKAFSMSPETGLIPAFGLQRITMRFHPHASTQPRGFRATQPPAAALGEDFNYVASFDLHGGKQYTLPVKGRGVRPQVEVLPRSDVDFGDLMTYEWADYPLTVTNRQDDLPVNVAISRSSYFKCDPNAGSVPPGSAFPFVARYRPKVMGKHAETLTVTVTSASGKVLEELPLYLRGTCSQIAEKPKLVGGPDKLPDDFKRDPNFIDPETANLERITRKADLKFTRPKVWEKDFAVSNDDPSMSITRGEKQQTVAHKDRYTQFIRAPREARAARKLTRKEGGEDDINLGMTTTAKLKGPQPKAEPGQPILYTPQTRMKSGSGRPRNRLPISDSDVSLLQTFQPLPSTAQQIEECARELTEGDITSLVVGPNVMDFGKISACSDNTFNLAVTNHLQHHILFMVASKAVPELDGTGVMSVCLPPGKTTALPLVLNVPSVQNYHQTVDYVINGMHIYSLTIVADVVPVSLEPSKEHINFQFDPAVWSEHVEQTVLLDNPNGFDAQYECKLADPVFSVRPAGGVVRGRSSTEVVVRWSPDNEKPGTVVDALEIVCVGGVPPHKKVHLRGELPEGKLSFLEKALDFGPLGLGTTVTRGVTLRNAAAHDCIFQVDEPEDESSGASIAVSPMRGKVSGSDTLELEVTMTVNAEGSFSTTLIVDVRGGKSIRLPIKAVASVPAIEVAEDEFDFGVSYLGATMKRALTLSNSATVAGSLRVDLAALPEFSLELPRASWVGKYYDSCPLVEEEPATSSAPGGHVYNITVAPSHTLKMALVFRPSSVCEHAFELPLVMSGAGVLSELRRAVVAEGQMPTIQIAPESYIDFGNQIVHGVAQKQVPTVLPITIASNVDEAVEWEFRAPTTDGQPNGKGVFRVRPAKGTLQPGVEQPISVEFTPRESKAYEGKIPLHIHGGDDAYLDLDVSGTGAQPRLSFDTAEVVLPAVPLGQRSEAIFYVVNGGYDNLELKFRLPPDGRRIPLEVELPEGDLIGIARDRLPVLVSFQADKPLSFTARLDFLDAEGKRYSILITGATDNSLLTSDQFLGANVGGLSWVSEAESGSGLRLEEAAYSLPLPNAEAVGPASLSPGLLSFLRAATNLAAAGLEAAELPAALAAGRGKGLVEMVEGLSGKPFQGKTSRLSAVRKEAADQTAGMFDRLLTHLKSHGALLNAVKAHFLLTPADLRLWLLNREAEAEEGGPEFDSGGENAALRAHTHTLLNDPHTFIDLQARAYHAICQQVVKIYVVSRITPATLKTLPRPKQEGAPWPSAEPKDYAGSNVYSPGESVLLAWAGAHLAARFPEHAAWLRAFDDPLMRSCLPMLALLLNHWPPLEAELGSSGGALKKAAAVEPKVWASNAALAAKLWAKLQLPFPLSAEQLLEGSPVDGLMLLAYAYQALPQLVPLTAITFEGRLNETQSKSIELSNPSRRVIAYNVRLEGSPEFSVTEAIVKLEPKSSLHFPVQVTPVSSHRSESKLVLSSRAEGSSGAPAATLVFDLVSLPRVRAPLARIQTSAKRYELKTIEVKVINPFPSDTELTVQLLPEPAEPLPEPRPPSNQKGRRQAKPKPKPKSSKEQAAKEKAAQEEAAMFKQFPDPFGCDRARMKLKFGQTDVLKVTYMPWTEGTTHCTVLLTSAQHGQFCYEITGEATPCDTFMKVEFQCDIDGPQVRDVPLSYLNKQLEEAKRLFMERHPSAKKKDQTALIAPGFQPLTPSGQPGQGGPPALHYTVVCNNPNVDLASGPILDLHDNPEQVWKDTASRAGRAVTPLGGLVDEAPSGRDIGPNRLRLALAPRGSGVYPVKLTLTSAYDTRVVLVTFTAAVRGRNSSLEFESPARASVVQEVPLVNNSDRPLEVRAKLFGNEAFFGASAVTVPPKSSLPYELRFCAPWIGEYKGTLEMSIPHTGEMNIYSLVGKAGEPVAEGHIALSCTARESTTHKLSVPNTGKGVARYRVYGDLDFVAGKESLSVDSGRTRDWTMTVTPPRAGRFTGSVTFATDPGPYVWFTLDLTVAESAPIDHIDVTAAVRAAAAVTVDVRNPLSEPASFAVSYSGRDVLGATELVVPAVSTTEHVFYFMPLAEGVDLGSVRFEHAALGEFWYELALTATPSEPVKLEEMRAPVGGRVTQLVKVPNPGRTEVIFTASSSNSRNFGVSPEMVAVPAGGEATLAVEFSPSSLSAAATSLVRLDSQEAGQWDYQVVGYGEPPEVGESLRVGASPGTPGTAQMLWRNPLDEAVSVSMTVEPAGDGSAVDGDAGAFTIMEKRTAGLVVEPGESMPLAVAFTPTELRDFGASLVISAEVPSQRETVRFKFPLLGLAETPSSGSVFKYSTKARSKLEAPLEVVLTGLSSVSPDEVFGFEVHPPPAERVAVDRFLTIREVHTGITRPDEALRYSVQFEPQKTMSVVVDLIITKKSGGRWRFEMHLEASQPDLDGELVVEAGVGQLGRTPLYLYAQGETPVEFTARLTTDTDLDLEVQPRRGTLYPQEEDGTWETSSRPPSLVVTYRNKDYGKRARGKLIVQTPESEFTYLLTGIISKYVPPDPSATAPRVSTKQDESLLRQKSPKRKNFVAAAARSAHRRGK